MLQNIFRNMPPVVKNLLLINVVLMLANFVFSSQQLNLNTIMLTIEMINILFLNINDWFNYVLLIYNHFEFF